MAALIILATLLLTAATAPFFGADTLRAELLRQR